MKIIKYSFIMVLLGIVNCSAMYKNKQKLPKLELGKDFYTKVEPQQKIAFDKNNFPIEEQFFINGHSLHEENFNKEIAYADVRIFDARTQEGLDYLNKIHQSFGYSHVFAKYDLSKVPIAKLQRLKIKNDDNKNRGLGTQLFEEAKQEIKKRYPTVPMLFLSALAGDGEQMQPYLLSFYKDKLLCKSVKQEILDSITPDMDSYDKSSLKRLTADMDDIFYINLYKE